MKPGRLQLAGGAGGRTPQQEPQQQPKRKPAMSSEKPQNLQDQFLNHIRKQKTPVTVFLVNGVKLQGVVAQFDSHTLLLRRDGHVQLIYKHAISTIMPVGALPRFADNEL
jgi:host factor-I protein